MKSFGHRYGLHTYTTLWYVQWSMEQLFLRHLKGILKQVDVQGKKMASEM